MPRYRIRQDRLPIAAGARRGWRVAVGPLLLCAVAIEGSACAMQPAASQDIRCTVEQADRLPPELRQDGAICGPLGRAVAAAAAQAGVPRESVAVKVKALSPYLLAVTVSVDGADLPEQKLGSSDRALTTASIDRLGIGLARQLTEFAAARR